MNLNEKKNESKNYIKFETCKTEIFLLVHSDFQKLFNLSVILKNNGKWEPNNIGATDFQYMEN